MTDRIDLGSIMAPPKHGRTYRLPTREEVAAAAAVLLRCNGADLDEWTDGRWPDDDAIEALRILASKKGAD